jgi:putative transposase
MRQRHSRLNFVGSIHFVTTVTRIRGFRFVDEDACQNILKCFEYYRERRHIDCAGYVLMPDHFHALLRQSTENGTVSELMKDFKQHTSSMLTSRANLQHTLWHSRYDDVPVPIDACHTKLQYIHANPVRSGLVAQAEDYRWSSIHDYLGREKGIVTLLFL